MNEPRPARYDHYIDGQWVPPATGEYFDSINPTTGQP
jgi:acyl-CoA reductase-like NAD-dependent aldehyde dehydrogenase